MGVVWAWFDMGMVWAWFEWAWYGHDLSGRGMGMGMI